MSAVRRRPLNLILTHSLTGAECRQGISSHNVIFLWILYHWHHQLMNMVWDNYRKTSNIRHTLGGNKIVDHSDVVGASNVSPAPTTSSFSTWHLASRDSAKKAARQYENLLSWDLVHVILETWRYYTFRFDISTNFTRFSSSSFKSCQNYICCNYDFYNSISSQIGTYHDSSAVMTCAKLWPDWVITCQIRTLYF